MHSAVNAPLPPLFVYFQNYRHSHIFLISINYFITYLCLFYEFSVVSFLLLGDNCPMFMFLCLFIITITKWVSCTFRVARSTAEHILFDKF